jgi:hypothetical protein
MTLRSSVAAPLVACVIAACSSDRNTTTRIPLVPTPAGSFTVTRTVYERLGDDSRGLPIEGVQVGVLYKSTHSGGSSVSDAQGTHRIAGVAAETVELQAQKDGLESSTRIVSPLRSDAAIDIGMTPLRRTFIGVVSEAPPSEATPIAGASVHIAAGSNKGRTTTIDGNGYYSLPDV